VIQRLIERLQREGSPEQTRKLLTAAYVLTGLRVEFPRAQHLFQGVRAMRESVTYMAILEEGRVEGTRKLLLRMGRVRFGEPDATTQAALQAITDPEQLERLGERLLSVSTWQELMQAP
jgi:hypothetical protein